MGSKQHSLLYHIIFSKVLTVQQIIFTDSEDTLKQSLEIAVALEEVNGKER